MNPRAKICISALLCGGSALLMLLHPLWLVGALAGLAILCRTAAAAVTGSETDPLTGLWNLRRLEHRRRRYEKAGHLAVLYLDLDNLKQINDTHGHAAGNAALQKVACALLDTDDDAYRIGGDEFLLISKEMDAAQLESCWRGAAELLSVHVSRGTAEGPGSALDALITRAEQNMYRDK